jgi:hypothetical protein
MTIETIDTLFRKLIQKRAIHNIILSPTASIAERRRMSSRIRHYRNTLKSGGRITIDTKLLLLQRAKVTSPEQLYSRADMINFATFVMRQGKTAQKDVVYVLEKWEHSLK